MVVLHHMHKAQLLAFHVSVKFDVVHLIVVCWALLLQSFGAAQIVHTWWPTEIFVHACVEVKPISILYVHPLRQQSIDSCHVVRQCKVFCFHAFCHGALVRRFWG